MYFGSSPPGLSLFVLSVTSARRKQLLLAHLPLELSLKFAVLPGLFVLSKSLASLEERPLLLVLLTVLAVVDKVAQLPVAKMLSFEPKNDFVFEQLA